MSLTDATLQGRNNHTELVLTDTDKDYAACMTLAGFGPAPNDGNKVLRVEGHQHSLLTRSKLQQLFVFHSVEETLGVHGEHVVPRVTKGRSNTLAGHVRVQKELRADWGQASRDIIAAPGSSRRSSFRDIRLRWMASSISSGKCSA